MITARQRIYEFIRGKGRVSVAELSRALRMTPANVRHHLSILIDEGAVVIAGTNPTRSRGRPTFLFELSMQARQNNLGELTGALLDEVLEDVTEVERSAALKSVAQRISSGKNIPNASLTQRLQQAVRHLNEHHYQARWEAHAEAPHIILGHCPFAEIISEHPELCQIDKYQLEELLNTPVLQKLKLAQDSRGGRYCLFILKEQ